MWSRANLKANAKVAFKRNYWLCVLVAFIFMLSTGSAGNVSGQLSSNTQTIISEDMDTNITNEILPSVPSIDSGMIVFTTVLVIIIIIVIVIALVLQFFLFGPLEVGCANFFKANAYEKAELNKVTIAFKKTHYMKMAATIFLKNLFIGLWSLLLFVPGIIKSYEYMMIPYILSDCPDISRQDAFRISKEMMRGNKMDAFILDLSFFGWILLTAMTCGFAGLFYVNPYVQATKAELFIAIREEYFKGQREEKNENNINHGWEN